MKSVLYVVIIVVAAVLSVQAIPPESAPVIVEQGSLSLHERRNSRGELHGLMQVYTSDGDLVSEEMYDRGHVVWSKDYWPNGQIKTYRYEDASYEIRVIEYGRDGNVVQTF